MTWTTQKDLEAVIRRINIAAGAPLEPYSVVVQEDGTKKYKANVGNYHLDRAYGGYQLQRMYNASGGVTEPLGGGYVSKRELFGRLHAYLMGMQDDA